MKVNFKLVGFLKSPKLPLLGDYNLFVSDLLPNLLQDGKALYTKITKMDPPFEIGSRKVNVSYQREPSAAKET